MSLSGKLIFLTFVLSERFMRNLVILLTSFLINTVPIKFTA